MSDRFIAALALVLKHEGGYVNHPNDPGGETYAGISRRSHPNLELWETIDKLKKTHTIAQLNDLLAKNEEVQSEIRRVYYTHYYKQLRADDLPGGVGEFLFDFAVNAGVFRAAATLQKVAKVVVDGVIGPVTIAAAQKFDRQHLLALLYIERVRYYVRIAGRNAKLQTFLLGWLNRTDASYIMFS